MIRLTFMTDPAHVIGASTPDANARRFEVLPPALAEVMGRLYASDHVVGGARSMGGLSSPELRDSAKIVLTTDPGFQLPPDLEHAEICTNYLDLVQRFRDSEDDLNVIGGLTVLRMFLHHADRLDIAETTNLIPGDLVFDEWLTAGFEMKATEVWEGGRILHAARQAGQLAANKRVAMALYDVMFNWSLPRAAAGLYLGDEYRQHNPHVGDGVEPFIEYFERMTLEFPGKRVTFKRAIAEGSYVVLHCHQHWPGDSDYAGIDIFRFDEAGRIVEHWDVLQPLPQVSANERGMF